MAIPYAYIVRNLWVRRLTTFLTALGMALVVFVFATVLMLSEGLKSTLVQTGSVDNVMVTRRSAQTEVQSSISREQAAIIESQRFVARTNDQRLASKEVLVLVVLTQRGSSKPANVTIRGLSAVGLALRPQVRVIKGRMFRPGMAEVIAGDKIAKKFAGAGLGEHLRVGLQDWTVVGVFDAGSTGFGSELWGDTEQMMQAFRRNEYSSVIFKLSDPGELERVRTELQADPRLTVDVKREMQFYAEQSEIMANFLNILGLSLSVIFSIGAIIGAMITMYAAVANRTPEIGTLRALGFKRRNILLAILLESLFLSLVGGTIGLFGASFMQLFTVSTLNWQTFSELAFGFDLSWGIAAQSLAFALAMGFLGGVLPAVRAARLKIVDALRGD